MKKLAACLIYPCVLFGANALAQVSVSVPGSEYCTPPQIAGDVEFLTEDSQLVAQAVDAYLREAEITREQAEALCRHPNDSLRIYLSFQKRYAGSRYAAALMRDDVSVEVVGTMVEPTEDCWVLLVDSGLRLQLEPLPRFVMRVGQRVTVTIRGPLKLATDPSCADPVVASRNLSTTDWGNHPTDAATSLERDVRRALEELDIYATIAVEGPSILVSGINEGQVQFLEEALGESLGMLRFLGNDEGIFLWPNAR